MRAPARTVRTARRLRRKLSLPEARLWLQLRERAPGRPVFRRQHPFGPYVLDFYCPKARLAVEVDGAIHGHGDRPARDVRRDDWLARRGIRTVRIAARDLLERFDETVDGIFRFAAGLMEPTPSTAPSLRSGAVPLPRFTGEEREEIEVILSCGAGEGNQA